MLVMRISVTVYLVCSSCRNACNEDISDCVSGVFIGVLMLVMRISVTVYLVCL